MSKITYEIKVNEARAHADRYLSAIAYATKPEEVMDLVKRCGQSVHEMGLAKRAYLLEKE